MISISFQRYDRVMVASRICLDDALRMTGSVCLKSPPISSVTPPKGLSLFLKSQKVRSNASMAYQCCGTISSHRMHFTTRIKSAHKLFLAIQQTDTDDRSSMGILNIECAVRPPGSKRAAILDDAVQRTIMPSLRSLLQITLYKKVFPVPPCPSIMNIPPVLFSTDDRTFS